MNHVFQNHEWPVRLDLTGPLQLQQGHTRIWNLSLLDPSGSNINTTSWSAVLKVRESSESPALITLATSGNGIVVGSGGSGVNITITWSAAATNAVADLGVGVWDLYVTDTNGNDYCLIEGNVEMNKKVSY